MTPEEARQLLLTIEDWRRARAFQQWETTPESIAEQEAIQRACEEQLAEIITAASQQR